MNNTLYLKAARIYDLKIQLDKEKTLHEKIKQEIDLIRCLNYESFQFAQFDPTLNSLGSPQVKEYILNGLHKDLERVAEGMQHTERDIEKEFIFVRTEQLCESKNQG